MMFDNHVKSCNLYETHPDQRDGERWFHVKHIADDLESLTKFAEANYPEDVRSSILVVEVHRYDDSWARMNWDQFTSYLKGDFELAWDDLPF